LGYKTFHPYIDESYDLETDDNKRMMMIVNEIERLSNFSDDELRSFIENINPICDHNFNVLNEKQYFVFNEMMTPYV